MNCAEIEELAGAYALRALPEETLREVENHLADCTRHPDIAALQAVALGLAAAADEKEPPPALKARLMDAVRREAAAEGRAAAPAPLRPRGWSWPAWPRLRPYALAAALALVAAGLLGWNVYLQTSDDGGGEATLIRSLTDGGGARGRIVYVRDEGVAVMTVEGLASLPDDKTYQVWAISEGRPTGIGLFDVPEGGRASAAMQVDLTAVDVIAVTVEPAGGSPQPTTAPVLSTEI